MLPGTDGASSPFWSPDSRFVGFIAGGNLKKIAVAGGPPVTLAEHPYGRSAWSAQGVILFNRTWRLNRGLDPIPGALEASRRG